MKFLAHKVLAGLRAVDEAGEEALRSLPTGELVMVEVKRPRNLSHHRLYWALVSLVHENLNETAYPTAEDFSAALKVCAGIRTQITMPNGTVAYIPGSISFAKMDQAEFAKFFDRVCDLITQHFLPGVTSAELRSQVEQMTGMPL